MMAKQTTSYRITKADHVFIDKRHVCRGCGDHLMVTVPRINRDVMDKPKYGGSYLCCGGPNGHLCWHMTKNADAKHLYEGYGPKSVPNWNMSTLHLMKR